MALGLAVRAAAYLQLMPLLDGFASRGGIAYREVHMSDNFAFGPALVEAHELETQVGRPVVSLSAEACAAARASAASWADPAEAFGEELLLDEAYAPYVDYLGYAWTDDLQSSNASARRLCIAM
jgi:hypothetical protein